MTNIEQLKDDDITIQFFKTFGIEPITYCKHFKYVKSKCDKLNSESGCTDCIGKYSDYPKITDRVLLELICIAYSAHDIDLTIEEIKENILQDLIKSKDEVKHQIQQLFKEGE